MGDNWKNVYIFLVCFSSSYWLLFTVHIYQVNAAEVQWASVNRAIFRHYFFCFGNTGADATIAILLPNLKRFSCIGAVDWSTTCFCCESYLQKRWQFCDRSAWISKRVWDSSQSCCSISPCHQDLGSKLRGYWFSTKEERWLCKNRRYTQEHCGSERHHWKDPHRAARRYSLPLGLSEASVRRISRFHSKSTLCSRPRLHCK